jgi:ribosomal protein L40E
MGSDRLETYLKLRTGVNHSVDIMAQKFEEAEARVFKDIYICRRCNARNKTKKPEQTTCRKCGYPHLRKKNEQFAG